MKRVLLILFLSVVFFFTVSTVNAQQGCCSHHGGIGYCDTSVGSYVCNDGTYSPSCGCSYIPPSPPVFPLSINATWNYLPNNLPNKTFDISVHLDDSSPTQYSATLNKCRGCNPGPLVDFYSNNFTFNNIGSGKWYLNVKKNIGGQWSTIVYWIVDVPTWIQPSPTPVPTPIIAISKTPVNPDSNSSDWLSTISSAIFILVIIWIVVWLCYEVVMWVIRYAKENKWVYTVIFWGIIIGVIILFSIFSKKTNTETQSTNPKFTCNCSKTCPNMTCSEAYYQVQECGCSARDGDGDGIPCEAQCK